MNESTEEKIIDLTPEGTYPDYEVPDAKDRGKVSISLPKWCEYKEHEESFETGEETPVKLSSTVVDMESSDFRLKIIIDDARYLDWWSGGSLSEYIETAKGKHFNSSWPISVDGHEGVVLIQGAANEGGEVSGDAFVILDDATVSFSAEPRDDRTLAADAYSKFFRSEEVRSLLDDITLSIQQ